MNYLFIDTHASKQFSLGFCENGVLTQINMEDAASEFLQALENLVGKKDIHEIILIKGPGSLTSLRIGASFALGLSLAKNIPLKSFSIYDLILREYPDHTLYFYTGTKKWVKKSAKIEEIIEKDQIDLSIPFISNFPEFGTSWPNFIELMNLYKEHADKNIDLIYPKLLSHLNN
jgi:hypothetical protein